MLTKVQKENIENFIAALRSEKYNQIYGSYEEGIQEKNFCAAGLARYLIDPTVSAIRRDTESWNRTYDGLDEDLIVTMNDGNWEDLDYDENEEFMIDDHEDYHSFVEIADWIEKWLNEQSIENEATV